MFTWQLKEFQDLSTRTLFEVLKLRQSVFVVEQECPYPDIDDVDLVALHLIGQIDTKGQTQIGAYARLIQPGTSYEHASIGRVIVAPNLRGNDYGRVLMQKAIIETRTSYAGGPIQIGAQQALENFYHSLGFTTHSDMYMEDGIPHIHMLLPNNE